MRCMVLYIRWADPIAGLPIIRHDDHRVIRALSDRLLRLTDTQNPRQQALINTYAAAMLAEYISLCGEAGEHQLPHQVGQYIRAHLRKRITLDTLARYVGLEKHYFGRRYKELTGFTPMDAVRRLRIDRAVSILRSAPGLPLKTVADRVGIGNGNLLSRWIKKQLHLTATDIRR
jgi:transcriptional regulator GlxA family with amidase domain